MRQAQAAEGRAREAEAARLLAEQLRKRAAAGARVDAAWQVLAAAHAEFLRAEAAIGGEKGADIARRSGFENRAAAWHWAEALCRHMGIGYMSPAHRGPLAQQVLP